jgi:hypothetical protein
MKECDQVIKESMIDYHFDHLFLNCVDFKFSKRQDQKEWLYTKFYK